MPRADRLFALIQLLTGPRRRSLRELADKLETTPRTLYRDLAAFEARGVPIERVNGTYRLVEGAATHAVPLSARERLLLTLALENPALERQEAYRRPLQDLRARLAATRSARDVAAVAGPDRSGVIGPDVTSALEDAVARRHSISILYTSLSSRRKDWRGLDPWLITHRAEAWYLIGRCHVHDEPRTFRLDRVAAVLPIGQSFERPAAFEPSRWFTNSWGVASSSEVHDVWIVFGAPVAPLIEHALHHPSEVKSRREDGGIDYRVRIGPLDEIARWIAGFGGAAVAMSPPSLVDRVREIASAAAEAHAEPRRVRPAAMVRRERGRPE
jgi:predicted DNA-binding transcriptional regulator YafY